MPVDTTGSPLHTAVARLVVGRDGGELDCSKPLPRQGIRPVPGGRSGGSKR